MTIEATNGAPQWESPQAATTRPMHPWRLPGWGWWLLVAVVLVGGFLVLRETFGRQIPELTNATFEAAWQRWQTNGPESYDLAITIEGRRPGEVLVKVRNRVVTEMLRDGQSPQQQRTWKAWSVPGMFDTIARELELAEDPSGEMGEGNVSQDTSLWLRAKFHAELGYPAEFHRAVLGGGPEVYWRVTRFEAR